MNDINRDDNKDFQRDNNDLQDDTAHEVGVGPWPGDELPEGDHWDLELLQHGDRRNVIDKYRYWKREAIKEDLDKTRFPFHIAIENLDHDFNIGSIVRTANAFAVRACHIVGRRRWNRRGAMVTDRYQHVDHFEQVEDFANYCRSHNLTMIGIDNTPTSVPIETAQLPENCVLIYGSESRGLSQEMLQHCQQVCHITQYGSTRSMNVGHAAAIAMWAWVIRHGGQANEACASSSEKDGRSCPVDGRSRPVEVKEQSVQPVKVVKDDHLSFP